MPILGPSTFPIEISPAVWVVSNFGTQYYTEQMFSWAPKVRTESQGCVSTWLCAVQCLCVLCGGLSIPPPRKCISSRTGSWFCSRFLHSICPCLRMSRNLFGFVAFESMNFQGFCRCSPNFRISMNLSGSSVEPFLFSKSF